MNEPIQNNRRNNVEKLIDDRFSGNKSAFAKAWSESLRRLGELEEGKEMPASMVHRWFWAENSRPIGEKLCRKIEAGFNLERYSLDRSTTTGVTEPSTPSYHSSSLDSEIQEFVEELERMSPETRAAALALFRSISNAKK